VGDIVHVIEDTTRTMLQTMAVIFNNVAHGGILSYVLGWVIGLLFLKIWWSVISIMLRFTPRQRSHRKLDRRLTQALDQVEARRMARQVEAFRVEPGDMPDYPRPSEGMAEEVFIRRGYQQILDGVITKHAERKAANAWRIEEGMSATELAELEEVDPFRRW
jgi:hypothetical protein